MSMIIELTTKKSNLNNILRSIVTNSDKRLVNKETMDIIAKDLIKIKPKSLIHCYTLKELIKIISLFSKHGFSLYLTREIIPNSYGLGLVRELFINSDEPESFNQLKSRYRYYFVLEQKGQYLVLTYNPEIKTQQQITIVLDDEEEAHCQVLQTKSINIREMKKEREVEDIVGTYTYYILD